MQVEDYKNQFVNTVYDLLNSETFSETHIIQIIDEENAAYSPWYQWVYGEEKEREREHNIERLKSNVTERREQVENYLKKYFGCKTPYMLSIVPCRAEGILHLNSLYLDGSGYTGIYDADYPVVISYEGQETDGSVCWMVNGEKIEGDTLVITEDMIWDGRVEIELITPK